MLRHCALYHRFIRAGLLVCSLLIAMLTASGQKGDSSLTKDFPKLSSKERSRIAAKEVEESKKDDAYQLAMLNAERSFQQGRYEEALVFYESARALRPYNVYPKVKIEDLHALINKQTIQTTDTAQHVAQVAPPPVPKDTIMPTVITEHVEPDPLPKKTTPVKTDPVPVGSASQKAPVKEEQSPAGRRRARRKTLPATPCPSCPARSTRPRRDGRAGQLPTLGHSQRFKTAFPLDRRATSRRSSASNDPAALAFVVAERSHAMSLSLEFSTPAMGARRTATTRPVCLRQKVRKRGRVSAVLCS